MTSPNKKQYSAFVEKLAIKNLVFLKLKYIYIFYKKHFTILANECGEVKKVSGPSMMRKESIWMLRISLCRNELKRRNERIGVDHPLRENRYFSLTIMQGLLKVLASLNF